MRKLNSIPKNMIYTMKKLKKYEGTSFFYYSLFYIILSISSTFLTMALPSFAIELISRNLEVSKLILYLTLYLSGLLLINFILSRIKTLFDTKANFLRTDMSIELGEKILDVDYMFIESLEGKNHIEKAFEAVYAGNAIGFEAFAKDSILIIISILGLLLYSVITSSLNIFILIILIICPLISILVNKKNVKWILNHKEKWIEHEKKLRYLKTQCIDIKNGKDIRLYKIENWFIDLFKALLNKRLFWFKKEYLRYFSAEAIDRFLTLIRDLSVYGYLLYKVTNGMNISSFVLYVGVVAGFGNWIKEIFDTLTHLQSNNIIINDFRNFIERKDVTNRLKGIPIPPRKTHEITFENVTFSYPDSNNLIFKNFNLNIRSGEKIALVGMNGAGKSTLVKLLCGLYKPDEGRILLDGIDVATFNIYDYFKEFAVVFQDVFTFAFTIAQNIACCNTENINYDKVKVCLEKANLLKKINSLPNGINTTMLKALDEDGIILSGGETQKLMLARALYKDASIIILDEPTAALDPIAESEMYEKYNSLIDDKTSIFISHRLSSTRFCTRILFMKDGKIVEEGSHDELINKDGEYAKMYEIQAHYYQKEVEDNVI
ncbi:MAG: ABC transporter ATP-binding protein [Clostridium sp.]|nr:ABC transporter ATP-binding protein [Clostridium sp.]